MLLDRSLSKASFSKTSGYQSNCYSLLEVCAPPCPVFERGRLVAQLGHQEECAHGMQVKQGQLSLGQLDHHDAHHPDIIEAVVTALP